MDVDGPITKLKTLFWEAKPLPDGQPGSRAWGRLGDLWTSSSFPHSSAFPGTGWDNGNGTGSGRRKVTQSERVAMGQAWTDSAFPLHVPGKLELSAALKLLSRASS